MQRTLLAAVLTAGAILLSPALPVGAQITAYECQQQFRQWAGPYMSRMLWFADQAAAYPLTPVGRPLISPGPIAAYPGFQGIAAGPGGPGWGVAYGFGVNQFQQYGQVNALTGGALSIPAVTQAFINAAPGGVPGLGTANLATLAPLQQGLAGNVVGAAALRESVVGNRLSAAGLNATMSSYPLAQAANMEDIVSAIQLWVANTCPAAPPDAPAAPSAPASSPQSFRASD